MKAMNIELTEEQKRYIAFGGIGAVLLIVLVVFGVRFGMSSITEAKQELEELGKKIETANRQLSRQEKVAQDFEKAMSQA